MINVQHAIGTFELGPVVIRALSSLTHNHASQIAQAVQSHAPGWDIDILDDYDGYLGVFVSQADDLDGPSYVISGTAQQVELSRLQDDTPHPIGTFDALQPAINALLEQLSSN